MMPLSLSLLLITSSQYFICPVSLIHHRGQDVPVPMGNDGEAGAYALKLKTWMCDIMDGTEPHEWAVVVPEKDES